MLVLSRKLDESIIIHGIVEVMVVAVDRRTGRVRLGIRAPREIEVHRKEIYEAILREGQTRP